ncbi:hypothetical protein C2845_PM11G05440 [Panicum miliaceum]|uniref:Uncharacterized protein n=1 Tax=Panicum miliaceum TaxID=4540 RepID=A0A3L6RQ00_PANMI|nr:hypothetical protein C2845_PM11G05440 [Panicum miliaceum]
MQRIRETAAWRRPSSTVMQWWRPVPHHLETDEVLQQRRRGQQRVSGEVLARGKPSTLVGRQASDYSVHVVSPPVLSPCNTRLLL